MTPPMFGRLALLGLLSSLAAGPSGGFAQGNAFTYQGQLNEGGAPASGIYSMAFDLYDAPTNGALLGNVAVASVPVTNGLFTTLLGFDPASFSGADRWLELSVEKAGAGTFTTLTPRQKLTATPYALMAGSASNLLGALPAGQLSGAYSGAVALTNAQNSFNGAFTGNGSGLTNVPGTLTWVTASTTQAATSGVGYLATNDNQQTVITLPAAPNVGDVVRVAGMGAGGWKIVQNTGQTILAGNLEFSQSAGSLWTSTYSGSGGFNGVTMSANGRNVAGLNGSRTIFSGDSGATWTVNSASAGNMAMAASSDGTKLVSAGSSIYTSPDGGKTWTSVFNNGYNWRAVASSADGSKLFALINGTPFPIYYSANGGATWTTNNMGSRSWSLISCSADGTRVAGVDASGGRIYYSTDLGATYSYTTNLSIGGLTALVVFPDGSRLVANAGGTLYFFQNGMATYTTHSVGHSASYLALSTDGSRMIAAGTGIYLSKDFGNTWTTTAAPNVGFSAVASSADGGRWAATTGSQIYVAQPATTTSTGYLVGLQGSTIELQYLGNNYFLPLSSQGTISAF